METDKKRVTIKNLGLGHHIFGAVFEHPKDEKGQEDRKVQPALVHATEMLAPGGEIHMTVKQLSYYDDDVLKRRVEKREFAVLLDGKDIRPDLAKRDRPAPSPMLKATESDESQEASVLADILAEGEPRTE